MKKLSNTRTSLAVLIGAVLSAPVALAQSEQSPPAAEGETVSQEVANEVEEGVDEAGAAIDQAGDAVERTGEEMMSGDGDMTGNGEPEGQPAEGQIVMQSENTILASNLTGQTVYSPDDEEIGDINDLIINLDGTVEGVVIGVGGFLGMGEKAVAIEMSSLELSPPDDAGDIRLMLSTTREELEAAPEFVTTSEQRDAEAADAARQEMEQNTATPMTPATDPAMTPADTEQAAPADSTGTQ